MNKRHMHLQTIDLDDLDIVSGGNAGHTIGHGLGAPISMATSPAASTQHGFNLGNVNFGQIGTFLNQLGHGHLDASSLGSIASSFGADANVSNFLNQAGSFFTNLTAGNNASSSSNNSGLGGFLGGLGSLFGGSSNNAADNNASNNAAADNSASNNAAADNSNGSDAGENDA